MKSSNESTFIKNFNTLLNEIEPKLNPEQQKEVNPDDLRKVAEYIDGLKPLSKMRKHKEQILDYLRGVDELIENEQANTVNLLLLKKDRLESVLAYLGGFHEFHTKNNAIHGIALIGIVIDIILSIIGIARYYYYIPVFMLLFLFLGVRKHRRIKREGKILDL